MKKLSNFNTEVGGGIILDKKKDKIIKMVIFPSDDRYKITFDNTKYDIEFHTHPVVSSRYEDVALARMPSPADVASTFTTGKEEIIFARNYVFSISIKDKDLFEKTKKLIREKYNGKKKFDTIYDRYRAYFNEVYDDVRRKAEKVERSKRVKYIVKKWKSTLKKFGIFIEKVNLKRAGFNIY